MRHNLGAKSIALMVYDMVLLIASAAMIALVARISGRRQDPASLMPRRPVTQAAVQSISYWCPSSEECIMLWHQIMCSVPCNARGRL